jgi:sialic acid synthase SpsE
MGVLPAEQDVRQAARRSIVAREHIPAGQVLTTRNLALRRPAGGLPPANWPSLLGRCAAQDIAADTPIAWNMVR